MNQNIEHAIRANKLEGSLKEKCGELMKIEGNMRGELLMSNFNYLKEKEGDDAVEKMEKLLKEYGYPLEFPKIKTLGWYKDGYCGVILFLLKEDFSWKEEDFVNMGEGITKYSFIVTKILLRYLVSLEFFLKSAPNLWYKHLDFGELEVGEFNKNKKYVVLKVKDYDIHPLTCLYQKGYYKGLFRYIIKEKNITVEEESCIYKGDSFHSYKIKWY